MASWSVPALGLRWHAEAYRRDLNGGPARTRTWDQGIHLSHSFLNGADYLITLNRIVRGGTL